MVKGMTAMGIRDHTVGPGRAVAKNLQQNQSHSLLPFPIICFCRSIRSKDIMMHAMLHFPCTIGFGRRWKVIAPKDERFLSHFRFKFSPASSPS